MTVDTGEFRALTAKVDQLGEVIDGHTVLLIRCLAAALGMAPAADSEPVTPRKRHLRAVDGGGAL